MIIQMTQTRNEAFLIKELLPIWKKYVDGFVFISDNSTDDTVEYLNRPDIKEKYNILEVLTPASNITKYETTLRQQLFDAAFKYSGKLICLDTDEYLDGNITKAELENIINLHINTIFTLQWIQYTGKNKRRVDSFWKTVFHDRIGSYTNTCNFSKAFSHSSHMPSINNSVQYKTLQINPSALFVSHLQWLDKRWVGIKQYYWKVWDFVNNKEHNMPIINASDYDASVNNFAWTYEDYSFDLKIREDIFSTQSVKDNYKLQYIVEQTKKHNIPNLGDWGMGIYEYCLK